MSEIPLLFWLVGLVAIVAVVLWVGSGFAQIPKRGGVAGMMVGADVEATLVDVPGQKGGRCRVHLLQPEGAGGPRVGLTFVGEKRKARWRSVVGIGLTTAFDWPVEREA